MEAKAATLSKAETQMDKQTLISAVPKTERRATPSQHIHTAAFSSPKLIDSIKSFRNWRNESWVGPAARRLANNPFKSPCGSPRAASPQCSLSIESTRERAPGCKEAKTGDMLKVCA